MNEDDKQFIQWLKEILIPDLKEDGYDATAQDFERLLRIIEKLPTK